MTVILTLRSLPVRLALLALATLSAAVATAQQANDRGQPPLLGATAGSPRDDQSAPERAASSLESQGLREPVLIARDRVAQPTPDRPDMGPSTSDQPQRRPRIAVPSEFEQFVQRTLGRKLPRFGDDLLLPEARDFALPPTATVPPDYILNAGDTLEIDLTGSIEGSITAEIDNDGRVFIPRVGQVALAGVRYGDLNRRLTAAVGRQFRNFTATGTLKGLRGIKVYVTGYATSPGVYTMGSLSTMANAVLAAGGPAAGGSFRSVQLLRGGVLVGELDLYDLLLRGDRSRDLVLRNEDVINIAPLGAQVAITGSVNAEAIYEARPGETVEALLALAGGGTVLAETDRLVLYRTADRTSVIGRALSRGEAASLALQGGDIVTVPAAGSLLRPLGQQAVLVRIEGEVARPGNYVVAPGTRLGEVLREAGGLTPQAFVYGTRFERASVRAQQKAGFEEAINQLEISLASAPLTSSGLNPGEEARQLAAAREVLARLRQAEPDGRLVLDLRPDSQSLPEDVLLENSDRLVIPPRPSAVGVFGAVFQPASFLLQDQQQAIADYIDRAGGPLRSADRGRLFVVRANGEVITRRNGALSARAVPGDVIFMPVKAQGPSLLAKLRDISTIVFQIGITGAAIAAILR